MKPYTKLQTSTLAMLSARTMSGTQLAEARGMTQQSASEHLHTLGKRGVIVQDALGRWSAIDGWPEIVQRTRLDYFAEKARKQRERKCKRIQARHEAWAEAPRTVIHSEQWENVARAVPYSVFTMAA